MHYNIFLYLLFMCFSISCAHKNQLKIGQIEVEHQVPIYDLPAVSIYVHIDNQSNLLTQKKFKETVVSQIKQYYPETQITTKENANIQMTINVLPVREKIIKEVEQEIIFQDGWAHKQTKKDITITRKKKFLPIIMKLLDLDINHTFYKKNITIVANDNIKNLSVTQKLLHPKKQKTSIPWIYNDRIKITQQQILNNNLSKALQELTQFINEKTQLLDKKKQFSLKQTYDLGTLYHNRASILKYLKRNIAAKKDQTRAQIIFSFIGNHHVKQ